MAVYLLTGEYNWASPPSKAAELARRIQGATYRMMPGLGHFPMTENPEQFATYVLPILDDIRMHSERRQTRV